MALVKCYSCKHVVSNDAESCANCGANFRRKESALRVVILLGIVGFLLYAFVTWF